MTPRITIVTTLYFSESFVDSFYNRIKHSVEKITKEYEIIFVNDGSPDHSKNKVLQLNQRDSRIILIDLSRNFGHHQAILTGLQFSAGDYVFLIDSDLEEDPELLELFWSEMLNNDEADVIFGRQIKRKGGFFEMITGSIFYRILNSLTKVKYPSNTLTARLMKRNYVDAVLTFREKALDVWSIFALVGFNQISIPVVKKSKGTSTYTFRKKLSMGVEIITSLSHRPLYVIFFIGALWLCLSSINILLILVNKWIYKTETEGWASIMASIWLIGGVIIFLLGLIGIYLSKVFLETKNRPITIVRKIYKNEPNE
jgi:putative glycosyltransferase